LGAWCASAAGGGQRVAEKRSRRGAPRVRGRPRGGTAGRDRIAPPADANELSTREQDSAYAAVRDGLLLEIGLRALDAAICAPGASTAIADAETLLRTVVAGGRSRSAVIATVERLRASLSAPMLSVCASALARGDEEEEDVGRGVEGAPFESFLCAKSLKTTPGARDSAGAAGAARRVSATNVFAFLATSD